MYGTLTDFLRTFSSDHPALWALLVMAGVTFTSLLLFCFWELVLRLLSSAGMLQSKSRGRSR